MRWANKLLFVSLAVLLSNMKKTNLLLQRFFCKNNVQGSLKNFFNVTDYQPMLLPYEVCGCGLPRYYKRSGDTSFLNVWLVIVLLSFQNYPSHSWWNSGKHKKYVLLMCCVWTQQTLAVSSPRQGRTKQGLLVIQTFPSVPEEIRMAVVYYSWEWH